MTNQEINERVAKLCGWKSETQLLRFFESGSSPIKRTTWFKTEGRRWLTPPNYAESLDACREFETAITGDDRSLYMDHIYLIVIQSNNNAVMGFENQWAMWNSTAIQRCEAFLRMKGQWDEN